MKWLTNRYAYPLITLVIVVSITLQLAWLNQLFKAQQVQVKRDLEQIAEQAAQISTHLSLVPGNKDSIGFKNFFLSPEWRQLTQALDNMRLNNVGSRFRSETVGDSTFVDINLHVFNGQPAKTRQRHALIVNDGISLTQEIELNLIDFKRMVSLVNKQLAEIGVPLYSTYALYNYGDKGHSSYKERKLPEGASVETIRTADFCSKRYAFNLRFLTMYQMVVPSVSHLVFYRMRYYLLSSCLMLLLTISVFVFILRLMKNERIYAQARVAFTGNITHELKTPVATIAIALETIMASKLDNHPQTLKSYLEISWAELQRLNLMIDKILNLEQLDSGQMKLRTELFDVQQSLQQMISSMRLQLDISGAILVFNTSELPCFVSGDPVHLTNVFYNLVENALKYGGKNVRLEITCTCLADQIKISFKDNGPGIAKEYQTRIFDRFFRVPSIKADIHNVKGSGLGLNYVKQTIEKHGGYVVLESKNGEGSNFIIYLPKAS